MRTKDKNDIEAGETAPRSGSFLNTAFVTVAVLFISLVILALFLYSGADIPFFSTVYGNITNAGGDGGSNGTKTRNGAQVAGAVKSPDVLPDSADMNIPALSLEYDFSEGTEFGLFGEYIAECSRDCFYLYNKDGSEEFRKNVEFSKPALFKRGDYLLVSDNGGRAAFVMKGVKLIWENAFASDIVNASINKGGYAAFVMDAAGYRSAVKAVAPSGKALFDWVVADDYVLGSEISPSGKGLVINRMKTAGAGVASSLEFLDMNPEPYLTVDSDDGEAFLCVRYLENNTLAVATDNMFRIYSQKGEILAQDQYDSILAMCEYPENCAALAVMRGNKSVVVVYDAKSPQARDIYFSDLAAVNMSADNGFLFINYGNKAAVIDGKGEMTAALNLKAEAQYGAASEKVGILVVTKKSADIFIPG